MRNEIDVKFYEKAMKRCGVESFKDVEDHDYLLIAMRAIEKQIPKKPIEKHYEDEGEQPYIKFKCPSSCGSEYQVLPHTDKYCLNCGQAIDWGDYE